MTKLNKPALVEQLLLHDVFADASKKQITEFVEDFFALLHDTVVTGGEVSIPGFGKFYKYANTKDGAATGKFTPKFTAFQAFKDAVNV